MEGGRGGKEGSPNPWTTKKHILMERKMLAATENHKWRLKPLDFLVLGRGKEEGRKKKEERRKKKERRRL